MEPRADWTCLSKKCATDEGAPMFEASIKATCCPECGSKRIKRLFNAINISSGRAKATDALVGPEYERQAALKDRDLAYRTELAHAPDSSRWSGVGLKSGPASQLGRVMAEAVMPFNPGVAAAFSGAQAGHPDKAARVEGQQLGQALGRPSLNHPAGGLVSGRRPRPGAGSLKAPLAT